MLAIRGMVTETTDLLNECNHVLLRFLVTANVEIQIPVFKQAFITLLIKHFEVFNKMRVHIAIVSSLLNKKVIIPLNGKGEVIVVLCS